MDNRACTRTSRRLVVPVDWHCLGQQPCNSLAASTAAEVTEQKSIAVDRTREAAESWRQLAPCRFERGEVRQPERVSAHPTQRAL